MRRAIVRAAAICVAVVGVAATRAESADATREVHGSADAFAIPGVALAWSVLRAAREEETAVVIRIEVDGATYASIEVVGKDPFTQREERLLPATAVGGPFDLKVARARFSEFPRTELRLWRHGPAPGAGSPALIVYYAGVPDTTPELAQAADLDRSLSTRIARVRAESARRSP